MRLPFATLIVLAASAACAHAGEDRYGPARPHAMQLASAGGAGAYSGRMLTWSSRAFTPQVPDAPPAQTAPERDVPAPLDPPPQQQPVARIEPRPAHVRPQPAAVDAPAARIASPPAQIAHTAPPAPQPAPRRTAASAPPALPESLYSPPPPAPAPQRLAQAAPPATPPTEGSHVRLYSVHRQYGMAPDAIPTPPANASNYVLIGVPADGAKAEAETDDKPF